MLFRSATPSYAQDDSYFYGGIGVGQARARIDDKRIAETLADTGLARAQPQQQTELNR